MTIANYYTESFPATRLRRNRQHSWLRDLVAQNHLTTNDLILPIFICQGQKQRQIIPNLPEILRYSIDEAIEVIKQAQDQGIKAIMLFPYIAHELKTNDGKEALNENNLICNAIKQIKKSVPNIGIISDVALDPYTNHGHDGLIDQQGQILNDETTEILCQQALLQAQAGSDFVAPSDMMDGRIGKIRQFLDQNKQQNTNIMAYSIKFASNFYGPFRDAVGSNSNDKNIDKKTYQLDYRNSGEAMREIAQDIAEGADSIIIKPGLPYLDIIKEAQQNFNIPLISYQTSGEYTMLKIAANANIFDFHQAIIENLTAYKRAGCNAIITYSALDLAHIINY